MMRHLLFAAALAVAGALPAAAQPDKRAHLITVTGEGEVAVVPDLAIIGAGVTTTGKTARDASEANAKIMTAVMAALKNAGIAEQDVQTARLSLHPVRDNKSSELRISGFQASNQVNVKLRDVAKTADTVDRLVAAGANDISGIQFVVSSPSKPLDQARMAAIADARRKAEVYAVAANVLLGAAVSITEEGGAVPGPIMMRQARPDAASTPVSPGEQIQRISVSVSYELTR
jgi:uncharacterized protein YggE